MRKRMTTDNPQGNLETMLNYAYAKDKRVILRYGDGERNIDLCDYISRKAKQYCCGYAPTPEEVMDGACMELECDCVQRTQGYVERHATLLGSLTDDNAKRSFGGYTCQIDKCERYTRQELEEWRGELKKEYPFFDELKKATDFFKSDEVLISIDDLKNKLCYRELLVMTR